MFRGPAGKGLEPLLSLGVCHKSERRAEGAAGCRPAGKGRGSGLDQELDSRRPSGSYTLPLHLLRLPLV